MKRRMRRQRNVAAAMIKGCKEFLKLYNLALVF